MPGALWTMDMRPEPFEPPAPDPLDPDHALNAASPCALLGKAILDRFLPENRDKLHRFQYLPFGAGPRTCICATCALQEAVIALGSDDEAVPVRYDAQNHALARAMADDAA